MTIALLCNRFPPELDGVGDYTARLAGALAQRNLNVHVICRRQPVVEAPEGVAVHAVVPEWGAPALAAIQNVLRKIRPDWAGLQYVPYGFQRYGLPFFAPQLLRLLRKQGICSWVMFHEVHIRLKFGRAAIVGFLQRRIAGQICRESHIAVTSIEFYRHLLDKLHPDIRVIPVGANVLAPEPTSAERKDRRLTFFPEQTFVISTFGIRNHAGLLQAVEHVHRKGKRVGLLVCGKTAGPGAGACSFPVHYTGVLPADQTGAVLQCSDLFVLPDFCSASGEGGTCTKSGSLAAAYAAGLPVIGVQGDMTAPPLRHGENIWLLRENSAAAFSQAVEILMEDAGLRQRLASGGKQLFQEHLSWEKIAQQHADFLEPSVHVEKNY